MKTIAVAITALLAIRGGILAMPASAYPPSDMMDNNTKTSGFMEDMIMWDNNTKMGMISSIQNDESGQPAWMVSGHFMLKLDSQNDTSNGATNITDFYAGFHMVRLDGSALHSHEIFNFTESENDMPASSANTTTIRGTSTVTMREGPVHNVDTEIVIAQDSVISISLDPAAIDNHFGQTPIYGLLLNQDMFRHMMNTTTSSMMGDMWSRDNKTGTMTDGMWK